MSLANDKFGVVSIKHELTKRSKKQNKLVCKEKSPGKLTTKRCYANFSKKQRSFFW